MPSKANGKVIFWSVLATFATMYAVHNIHALRTVSQAVGLDD